MEEEKLETNNEPVVETPAAPVEPVEPTPAEPAVPVEATSSAEPPKKSKSGLIIIIVLILLLGVFAVCFFVLGGNGFKKNKTRELTEKEITELISYVPYATPYPLQSEEYNIDEQYSAYTDKKVSVKEMDKNWLLYNSMTKINNKGKCEDEHFNLNEICDYTLSKDDVLDSLKNLYGDLLIELPNEVKDNYLYKCVLGKDVYSCSNPASKHIINAVTIYFDTYGDRSIIKYEKIDQDDENAYIYVKYARLEMIYDENNTELKAGDITFRLLKYGTGNELIDEKILNASDYYDINDISKPFKDKIYEEFKDKMTTYKLTYKFDGYDYHLTDVEPVK